MPECLNACRHPSGILQGMPAGCAGILQQASVLLAQVSKMDSMPECLLNRRHCRGPRASIMAGTQAFCPFCWPGLGRRMPAGGCLRNPQASPAGCLKDACRHSGMQACRHSGIQAFRVLGRCPRVYPEVGGCVGKRRAGRQASAKFFCRNECSTAGCRRCPRVYPEVGAWVGKTRELSVSVAFQ